MHSKRLCLVEQDAPPPPPPLAPEEDVPPGKTSSKPHDEVQVQALYALAALLTLLAEPALASSGAWVSGR